MLAAIGFAAPLPANMRLHGHETHRASYRNTMAYFLRLPDGNPRGSGYAGTGRQSLRRLAEGMVPSHDAVDRSAIYNDRSDPASTMRAIVDLQRGNIADVQIDVAALAPRINPGDHSDYRMTAKLALDAIRELSCIRSAFFINYASARLPENLSAQQKNLGATKSCTQMGTPILQ